MMTTDDWRQQVVEAGVMMMLDEGDGLKVSILGDESMMNGGDR